MIRRVVSFLAVTFGGLSQMIDLKVPAFGVCLGLQGIVEEFGGELAVLDYPMHGKVSCAACCPSSFLPANFPYCIYDSRSI